MKLAVVTGANRGLGLESAKQLLERGYKVLLCSRKAEEITKICQELGENAIAFKCDVSNEEDVLALRDVIKSHHDGKLHTLVNNAGIYKAPGSEHDQSLKSTPPKDLATVLETNTLAAYRMIHHLLPLLEASEQGRIVNVSSGMGEITKQPGSGSLAYRISKTALNAITVFTAQELGESSHVKINSVCPGWVRTDMGGASASRSIPEGASGIVWAATLPNDGPTGLFFRDGKAIDW